MLSEEKVSFGHIIGITRYHVVSLRLDAAMLALSHSRTSETVCYERESTSAGANARARWAVYLRVEGEDSPRRRTAPKRGVLATAEQEDSASTRSLRPVRPLDQWTV